MSLSCRLASNREARIKDVRRQYRFSSIFRNRIQRVDGDGKIKSDNLNDSGLGFKNER
jgi:hypothetical protein